MCCWREEITALQMTEPTETDARKPMGTKEIIALFHKETPDMWELKNIRMEDDDARWILSVRFGVKKYIIKIASNSFTNAARVSRWPEIIAAYKEMGYYSPALLKSIRGFYAEDVLFSERVCVVWEEEYAKYPAKDTLDATAYTRENGQYLYQEEVLDFVAKVAQKHFSFFPYCSGWARFEPFEAGKTTDEVTECVEAFDRLTREKAPGFLPQWKRIRTAFEENARKLRKVYSSLPVSVFQSDESGGNLLLDENGHFMGVIDYNLAGRDVVLNRFFSLLIFGCDIPRQLYHTPNILPKLNRETQNDVLQAVLSMLQYMKKHYTFCEQEIQAAPLLWKYITCVEYAQLAALEKHSGETDKLEKLFDYMEQEITRNDLDFRAAMLGE